MSRKLSERKQESGSLPSRNRIRTSFYGTSARADVAAFANVVLLLNGSPEYAARLAGDFIADHWPVETVRTPA